MAVVIALAVNFKQSTFDHPTPRISRGVFGCQIDQCQKRIAWSLFWQTRHRQRWPRSASVAVSLRRSLERQRWWSSYHQHQRAQTLRTGNGRNTTGGRGRVATTSGAAQKPPNGPLISKPATRPDRSPAPRGAARHRNHARQPTQNANTWYEVTDHQATASAYVVASRPQHTARWSVGFATRLAGHFSWRAYALGTAVVSCAGAWTAGSARCSVAARLHDSANACS